MAEKIASEMQLNDQQRNQLQNIIGSSVAKPKTIKSTTQAASAKQGKLNRPRSH